MNYTKEELEKFWNFVKVADYKSDNDYNRINKLLFSKYAEDAELFYEIFHELSSVLYDEYKDAWLDEPGIEVSDDGWDDLRADIVSRGKDFYENISVSQMQDMAVDRDYEESFSYSFQDL